MKKLLYTFAILSAVGLLFLAFNSKTTKKSNPTKPIITEKATNEEHTLEQKIVVNHEKTMIEKKPAETHIHTVSDENISEPTDMFSKSELTAFKTIHPKIIEEMNKVPECLMQADTKEDAFVCSKGLRDLNKKLALAMGINEDEMANEEQYGRDFTWDEKTKVAMIQEIESSQEMMQVTQDCIANAETPKALEGCFGEVEPYEEPN